MNQTKVKALPTTLTRDQIEALAQVSVMQKGAKPSACVARNAKHLTGTKYMLPRRDGTYVLTEKGAEILFTKNCIAGLRAVAEAIAANAAPPALAANVAAFLNRKSYIATVNNILTITDKGRECLADITENG